MRVSVISPNALQIMVFVYQTLAKNDFREGVFARCVSVISPNALRILVFSRGPVFKSCLEEPGDSAEGHLIEITKTQGASSEISKTRPL